MARTAQEIQRDSSRFTRGDEPGLAAYYRFDEASGTTAHDATPNHRDAVLASAGGSVPVGSRGSVQAIDLGGDGVTYSSPSAAQGPNRLQNYPIIASTDNNRIQGWLTARTGTTYHIEFFASTGTDDPRVRRTPRSVPRSRSHSRSTARGWPPSDVAYTPVTGMPSITATTTDPEEYVGGLGTRRPITVPGVAHREIHRRDVGADHVLRT